MSIVTLGQSRFFGVCPYLHYTAIFLKLIKPAKSGVCYMGRSSMHWHRFCLWCGNYYFSNSSASFPALLFCGNSFLVLFGIIIPLNCCNYLTSIWRFTQSLGYSPILNFTGNSEYLVWDRCLSGIFVEKRRCISETPVNNTRYPWTRS